ncbi:MAG TPA: GAF and ANTAR domain-containing protein [Microlunatus sp.]
MGLIDDVDHGGVAAGLRQAEEFARLAEELGRPSGEQPTLERIVELAVETIDACDYCGVSLRDADGTVSCAAGSDPVVPEIDDLHGQLDDGPFLDTVWELDTRPIANTAVDSRWPRWSAQVALRGIGSILSLKLDPPQGQADAALNLYARQAYAFDPTDLAIASIFARHAGVALGAVRVQDGLRTAVRSRQIIGVAQGILMQRFGLSLDASFELLRRYSQDHNLKLRTIAANLVAAGGLSSADPDLDSILLVAAPTEGNPDNAVGAHPSGTDSLVNP